MLAFWNGKSAQISYDKITRCSREHIHPAISVLIDMQLISVSNDDDPESKNKSPNKYHFYGL